jgi:hypothetical protein
MVTAGAAGASTVAEDGGDTGAVTPGGGVAVAVAVFAIDPASMSACVTAYVAVQSTLAAGANGPGGHVATGTPPLPENTVSSIAIAVSVTLPVLVTWNVYVTTSPAAVTVAGLADLATVKAAVRVTSTVADEGGDTGGVSPGGGVAVAVAVFAIDPASISAWVTAYVAVQSTPAAGANGPGGHVATGTPPVPENTVSSIAIAVSVTLPVFVTWNV